VLFARGIPLSILNRLAFDPFDVFMSEPDSQADGAWSTTRRSVVSVLVLFHLFCVALAPLAVVEPRPLMAVSLQQIVSPYSESLFLLHGYRFFAPEPGPGHLVSYRINQANGQVIEGLFPDRDQTWPRLLYHRWFMLSETVYQHVSETLDAKQLQDWQAEVRDEIKRLGESDPRAAGRLEQQLKMELQQHQRVSQMRDQLVVRIGKHLLQQYDGQSVEMNLLTRVIPAPEDIAIGLKLDNPQYLPQDLTYSLGTVYSDRDELESIEPLEQEPAEINSGKNGAAIEGASAK